MTIIKCLWRHTVVDLSIYRRNWLECNLTVFRRNERHTNYYYYHYYYQCTVPTVNIIFIMKSYTSAQ